jgi:glycosyltransferase involved in cell wall biosynthesis
MKIIYIANARIPTEKAHGVNIVHTVSALAGLGIPVTLVLPKRSNPIDRDLFSYYGVEKHFDVEYIPIVDLVKKGFWGYWLSQFLFSFALARKKWDKREYVILTRDEWSGWLLSLLGYRVFYDMHGFPETWRRLWKVVMKTMTGIICTNAWKMKQMKDIFEIQEEKMLLARNGFDALAFTIDFSKEDARSILNISPKGHIVMYTGHLYDWKGADVLARAASYIKGTHIMLVGGDVNQAEDFKKRYAGSPNILIVGQKPHEEIPFYLKAADVLVLPNSRISSNPRAVPYSIYDTSPIKLFEYMSSKRPIVASDLPSIREVVNEQIAFFFEPDNPEDLARKIQDVIRDTEESTRRADRAFREAQQYTWEARARAILTFMERKNIHV